MLLFFVSLLAVFMLGALLTIPESPLVVLLSEIHPGLTAEAVGHSLRV